MVYLETVIYSFPQASEASNKIISYDKFSAKRLRLDKKGRIWMVSNSKIHRLNKNNSFEEVRINKGNEIISTEVAKSINENDI